jgi:hypothetical protein
MGIWSFRILQVKRCKSAPSFAEVRESLLAHLESERLAGAWERTLAALQQKRSNRGMRIFEAMLDERIGPTKGEIDQLLTNHASELAIPPDTRPGRRQASLELSAKIRLLEEKRSKDYTGWLESSVILKGI